MTQTNNKWRRVSSKEPCLACGKPDWCRRCADGMIECRRVSFPGSVEAFDRNGVTHWLGHLNGEHSKEERAQQQHPIQPVTFKRLSHAVLNRVYSHLLDELPLSLGHWENLKGRGFTKESATRHGFKSFSFDGFHEVATKLTAEFPEILDVPGFRQRNGRVYLAAVPGLLIPCRDVDGLIVALRVRPDRPGAGGKYRWVSSVTDDPGSQSGPGPASLASCWRPLHMTKPGVVRLVEGELCAARLAEATGVVTISAGSVAAMASLQVLEMVRALGPRQLLLCPDANWRTNPHVAGAVRRSLATYEGLGIPLSVEVWGDDVA